MVKYAEGPDDVPDYVQLPVNGEFICPLCEDFGGPVGAVEAHITGKSDNAHRGVVGKDFRIEIKDGDDIMTATMPVNQLLEEALRHSSETSEL